MPHETSRPGSPATFALQPPLSPRSSSAVRAPRPAAGASGRLGGRTFAVLLALLGLVVVAATDQVVPATSAHQAELRIWLASRAAGFMTLAMLTLQIVFGLVLSHPTNKTTWKLSKRLFPWHENAWVFVLAFLLVHIVATVLDEYADVGLIGAIVPGLSAYRSSAIALGTMSLYALLITGLTARYTKRLPAGAWLVIHRFSLVVWAFAWTHGLLAGTDSGPLGWLYGASFALVTGAAAYRYWVSRQGRPTFSTSLPEVSS